MGKRKLIVTAALLALLPLALAGCGKSSSSQTKQELNLVEQTDPTTLDVNDVRNANEFDILSATQQGLFRITSKNGKDSLQLAGAKSYKVSKDGLVYTFKLRKSDWSDGKPVVAQQYVDSIIRELTPKNAFAYATMAYDIKGAEAFNTEKGTASNVGVAAPNKDTLQITLAHKTPYFLKKLASVVFYPVRTDLIKKHGNKAWKTDWKDQVYNGAFKIKQWKTNGKLVLTKNNKFWNAKKVKLNKVTYTTTSKDSTVVSLLQSGQLDAVITTGANASDFNKLTKSSKITKQTQTGSATNFVIFNQHTGGTSKLLNNTKIREALSLAINRNQLNKLVNNNQASATDSFVPKSVSVSGTNYHQYAGDILKPELAQYNTNAKLQALFKSGLQELGKSTDLSKVNLVYLTTGSDDTGTFLKQEFHDRLGINVTIKTTPDDASFIAKRNANQYDLLSNAWAGDYDDPSTFLNLWVSNGGFQKFFGGYNSKSYDQLYATLAPVSDTQSRLKIYKQLETKLLTSDFGVAPVTTTNTKIYKATDLHNFQTPVFGPTANYIYAYKK